MYVKLSRILTIHLFFLIAPPSLPDAYRLNIISFIDNLYYSVFQGLSKAKSANGGSILIFDTAPAASKNKAHFKSGQS
jgi:hypothetical protein